MGGELVGLLSAAGHSVVAAARRPENMTSRGLVQDTGIRLAAFDLTSAWPDMGHCDVIVHLGGQSRPQGRPTADYVAKNVGAIERLLDFARRARPKLVVFASSLSVFGKIEVSRVDEDTPVINPECYGMSKRMAEIMLAENADWLNSLSLRLPGVLGPKAPTPWLASVLRQVRASEIVSIHSSDKPFNNGVHIFDLAAFISKLADHPPKGSDMVVLGADGETTVRGAVETLRQASNSSSPIREIESDRKSFWIDSSRARGRYGYVAMNISDMLRRFAHEG